MGGRRDREERLGRWAKGDGIGGRILNEGRGWGDARVGVVVGGRLERWVEGQALHWRVEERDGAGRVIRGSGAGKWRTDARVVNGCHAAGPVTSTSTTSFLPAPHDDDDDEE